MSSCRGLESGLFQSFSEGLPSHGNNTLFLVTIKNWEENIISVIMTCVESLHVPVLRAYTHIYVCLFVCMCTVHWREVKSASGLLKVCRSQAQSKGLRPDLRPVWNPNSRSVQANTGRLAAPGEGRGMM